MALRWKLARDVVAVVIGRENARRGSAPHESEAEALRELLALSRLLLETAVRLND